ncbi:MAG: nucleoside deaminase [Microbacteriaceae bacterium]
MTSVLSAIAESWSALPAGARTALEQQWAALAAGGLPCGAAVVDPAGTVIALGRNHVDEPNPADGAHDRTLGGTLTVTHTDTLSGTRIAHAELGALAAVGSDRDWSGLTLFATQHPCSMCMAALTFTRFGRVVYIADDLSDTSSAETLRAHRGAVRYQRLGSIEWALIATVMFLYTGAEQRGDVDGNLRAAITVNPAIAELVLAEVADGRLGRAARSGASVPEAFAPLWDLFS